MKRFWITLLTLSMIATLGTTAFAADARFSGEYYLQGWYNKNASLVDQDSTIGPSNRGASAFYTQRLRMGIDFNISKGLKLGTRFDALDRKWMAARTAVPTSNGIRSTDSEAENIAFEIAYLQFMTPIGMFLVGNVPYTQFGTPFSDYNDEDNPILVWGMMKGPWVLSLSAKKTQDGANGGTPIGGGTDFDGDSYTLKVQNRWSTGDAGLQFTYIRSRISSTFLSVDIPFTTLYARNQFGKVFVEDEAFIIWGSGKIYDFVSPAMTDIENGFNVSNYFNINVDLSPAKIGFMFVYSPGDDPSTPDKKEGGYHTMLSNEKSFNPCLILFNDDYVKWMGAINGNQTPITNNILGIQTSLGTSFDNVWFYQVYGDFSISPKLKIGTSFTYAYADEKPSAAYVSKKYGYELDATLKYRIYENLEYMIGAAYLWTGDYFKGTSENVKLSDNYLLTHKLTLTF